MLYSPKDIRLKRVLNQGEKLFRQDQPPVIKPMLMAIAGYLFFFPLSNCSNKTQEKERTLSS